MKVVLKHDPTGKLQKKWKCGKKYSALTVILTFGEFTGPILCLEKKSILSFSWFASVVYYILDIFAPFLNVAKFLCEGIV